MVSDQLTNQIVTIPRISGGNVDLKPEIAKTYTAGIVLKPSFLDGFTASVDYFKIQIDDAIASPFSYTQILDICAASNYTHSICGQVVRPLGPSNPSPANAPTAILLSNANIGSFQTSGIDFELSYRRALGAGELNLRARAAVPFMGAAAVSPDLLVLEVVAVRCHEETLARAAIGDDQIGLGKRFLHVRRLVELTQVHVVFVSSGTARNRSPTMLPFPVEKRSVAVFMTASPFGLKLTPCVQHRAARGYFRSQVRACVNHPTTIEYVHTVRR